MTDQVLDILKLVLLALLYLFFARVLWAVWSEVREPADLRRAGDYVPPSDPTTAAPVPTGRREPKPARGRGGRPARLVVLEPKQRRGTAYAITGVVSIGRDEGNTIQITDDSYVSGHHATIAAAGSEVVVDDLKSRNGTYLNGARLSGQRTVHAGDRIQVGYTVLEAQ
jgi:pSer/pThr/pTyr-binding forkhead associated (FHA) protein